MCYINNINTKCHFVKGFLKNFLKNFEASRLGQFNCMITECFSVLFYAAGCSVNFVLFDFWASCKRLYKRKNAPNFLSERL